MRHTYGLETRRRALALLSQGLTVADVSRRMGISRYAIGEWRRRVEQERPLYAPRQDQGSPCARCADPPAAPEPAGQYAYLLGLYLGDGAISPAGRGDKGVWRLRISCADAWPGLRDECVRAVHTVMPGNKVQVVGAVGCSDVGSYSKHWPCLFPQHGAGKKHTRKITLEGWQTDIVDRFAAEFVRGLIHSDGCRAMNRVRHMINGLERWYEYPRYFFTNESADIRTIFTDALDRLGVAWKQSNRITISVARRDAVARLDEFIGPKY